MRISPHAIAALSFAFATACAGHAHPATPQDPVARERLLLTRNDLAPGRHCEIVDPEVALPPIETILDTAAVPVYMRQTGVSADSGYALFSIRYDSAGKPVRARLVEGTIADSLVEPIVAAIAAALLPRAAGAPLAARLRVDLAPSPAYRLGKSEYCPPEPVVQNHAPDAREAALPRGPSASRSVTEYRYDAQLSATGEVESIQFLSSISPSEEQELRARAMKLRWKPALDDGLPVSGHAIGTTAVQMRIEVRP